MDAPDRSPSQVPDRPSPSVPFLGWRQFLSTWPWRQGEHVSLVAPTQQGKTTFGLSILPVRDHVVIMATKPKDPTLEALKTKGWRHITEWPPPKGARKVLLWPPFTKPKYEAGQMEPLADAMAAIFEDGGWTVYFDEVVYITDDLKLEHWVTRYWRQGSAMGITVVAGTQRPAYVPLDMYSAASWLVLFRTNDRRDLDRLASLGGADRDTIRQIVPSLGLHEVLVVNTRSGDMLRTRVELPGRKGP